MLVFSCSVSPRTFRDSRSCTVSIHLLVWGDFGSFESFWSHPGCGRKECFKSLDRDYFLDKVVGEYKAFDPTATIRNCEDMVLDMWRQGALTKEEFFNDLSAVVDLDEDMTLERMCDAMSNTRTFCDGYWDIGVYAITHANQDFWNVWCGFVDAMKSDG